MTVAKRDSEASAECVCKASQIESEAIRADPRRIVKKKRCQRRFQTVYGRVVYF